MKIEIGGKIFELDYTVNAICDLEEMTGKGLGDILGMVGLSSVRSLLWCGLAEHTPNLTMAEAGVLLQQYTADHNMEELVAIITEAIEAAGFMKAQSSRKKAVQRAK